MATDRRKRKPVGRGNFSRWPGKLRPIACIEVRRNLWRSFGVQEQRYAETPQQREGILTYRARCILVGAAANATAVHCVQGIAGFESAVLGGRYGRRAANRYHLRFVEERVHLIKA